MKYQFKQAAMFTLPSAADGKGKPVDHKFPLGSHEVPSEVEDHHYFKTLKGAGLIVEDKSPTLLSQAQKNELVAAKFAAPQEQESEEESKPKSKKK